MKLVRILLVLCLLFTMASCSSKPNCGPLDETDDLPTFYYGFDDPVPDLPDLNYPPEPPDTADEAEIAEYELARGEIYYDPSFPRPGQFVAGWKFESGRRIAIYYIVRATINVYYEICIDDGEGWYLENSGICNKKHGKRLFTYNQDGLPTQWGTTPETAKMLFVGESIGVIVSLRHDFPNLENAASYTLDGGVTWQSVITKENTRLFLPKGINLYYDELLGFEAAPEGENIRLTFRSVMDGTEYQYSALLTKDGLKADTSK
ncbi:MAG: hypothetical protein IKM04_02830 [Clostridia bacterium]|nr:hypothetical protein [Clostridia bacterium]